MSEAATREPGLYLPEREVAKRLGMSEDRWRMARKVLESDGLPPRNPLMGGRYWPAVKAFFDRREGLGSLPAPKADGGENLDAL